MEFALRPSFALSLLGRFALTGPDGAVDLPNKKLSALLAYLACSAPAPQSREKLATLLWGSHFDAQAKQNLRQALFKLRQLLGHEALLSQGELVSLNSATFACDVAEFEALMREGDREALGAAADLYRGRFLDDVSIREDGWGEWLEAERTRLHELALNAMVELGKAEFAAGHIEQSLKAGQRAHTLNNFREDAHRLIVQALSATGRKAEALKFYQDITALLKRELNTEPDAATKLLAAQIRSTRQHSEAIQPEHAASPAALRISQTAAPDTGGLEQRHLTILVCKLVGSLSDRFGMEDVHDLIAAFHSTAAELARQFGGFVAHYQGNGVLVYFGYPAAHEHDAEQAVRAGRAILDAVATQDVSPSVTLQASVGIASGLVIVGEKTTAGDIRQHIAIGDAPNLAARLQAVAACGEVVIADGTQRLVGPIFKCRAFGAVEGNGLPPLTGWKVDGEAASAGRFQARRGAVTSPLVGRQDEMGLLQRRWDQAKHGEGRVVLLSGEPGIGKSRIAESHLDRTASEPHTPARYACAPHHAHSPLHPFIEQLRQVARFEPGSDTAAKLERLAGLLNPFTEHVARDVALVAELLGVATDADDPAPDLTPEQKREMIFSVLLHQLEHAAAQCPLAILFEDVHWIDPTSLDLLDRIVARIAALPVMLIVTFRTEFQPAWIGQPHVTMLPLSRLGRADSAGIVSNIAQQKHLPASIVDQVVSRTDGVPLFIEELTSALLESGQLQETPDGYLRDEPLPPLAIPMTLQASLASRLDRLGTARDLALIGSAIGREFSHKLVAAVSGWPAGELDAALERLLSSGLISRRGTAPDSSYTFKHALVQDAAYTTMLRKRRQQLHAAIAGTLLERFPALSESQPEIVAHHFDEAGLAREAIDRWTEAARLARAHWANREAVAFFERALRLMVQLPESDETLALAIDVRLELRSILAQLAEPRRALDCLREAEALTERLNDDRRRARIYALMTNAHTLLCELDEALASGKRARAAADRLGDLRLQIVAATYLEQVNYFRGDYREVVTLATGNLAALPDEWALESFGIETPPAVYDRGWLMMSLAELGRFDEAAAPAQEAIRVATATERAHPIGWADISIGTAHSLRGEWAKARPFLERSTAVSKKGNVGVLYPSLAACLTWVLAQLGETRQALGLLQEGELLLQHHAETGYVGLLGWLYMRLGRAALVLGRVDDADRLGRRALGASLRQPGFAAHAQLLLGEVAIHPDRFDADKGEAHFREALALAETLAMNPVIAHTRLGLSTIFQRTDRPDQAREQFAAATMMYRGMGMEFWLRHAEIIDFRQEITRQ
ncbi:BTAD domain-containing putative transcriptional regulator [Bradyrhizobium sp. 930_D9_N1_4]|uniref:BTAD domain-containing putative transcriptional regulator n=1 Tax=Bradyrhizobium sp. 930_D9_N1_4 TaxID=3240374 RepID=UPI003F89115D